MFARIVAGLLIGLVAGIVEALGPSLSTKWRTVSEALIFLLGLGFVISSFMFGAVYGVMAVAEIAGGYFVFTKIASVKKARS
ncbi:hypothetical protein QEM11_003892 [Pseudomonas putida]|nr:hypothetical protein [Pseudomonas putida]